MLVGLAVADIQHLQSIAIFKKTSTKGQLKITKLRK
jgi:hypothetical protein